MITLTHKLDKHPDPDRNKSNYSMVALLVWQGREHPDLCYYLILEFLHSICKFSLNFFHPLLSRINRTFGRFYHTQCTFCNLHSNNISWGQDEQFFCISKRRNIQFIIYLIKHMKSFYAKPNVILMLKSGLATCFPIYV